MMWKQIVGVTMLWICCSVVVMAQKNEQSDRFARIEKEKKAYITKQLTLTPSEVQAFFPIYEQYRTELTMLQRERRQVRSGDNQGRQQPRQNLRNERFQRDLSQNTERDMIAFDSKRLELKKNYRQRFAEVIGQARASQFFQAEEEFNEYLMRHLQNRRRKQGPNP